MNDVRDRYELLLRHQELQRGEAVILLAGEDTAPRVEQAVATFRDLRRLALVEMQATEVMLVVTGGKHNPPRWMGAVALEAELLEKEVAPHAILLDTDSGHTREQAVATVDLMRRNGWRRVYIVASTYHIYRAHLTFLKALREKGLEQTMHVVPVAASADPLEAPEGMNVVRSELFFREREKVTEYQGYGHVASYEDGLAYLAHWRKRP